MKRLLTSKLIEWKNKKIRKPLILQGARQVGKTWLLKNFGKKEFKKVYHLDFEKDKKTFVRIFENDLSPIEILNNISLFLEENIDIENDLLIFDEIQNIPRALTALKYFCEDMPKLALCAAGSLLGISFLDESYPVGKIEYLTLHPMNFEEFLLNYGNNKLYNAFKDGINKKEVNPFIHEKLIKLLREYYVTGGMPESLNFFFKNKNVNSNIYNEIREIQKNLVISYMRDINKHSGKTNALHIETIFNNIPMQLARNFDDSVQRYKFKGIISNKKGYNELRNPIDWLLKAELIIKVKIANKAELPLKFFSKDNLFKLYLFDIGILGAMLELPPATIILGDYAITKGFFIENFVMTEMKSISANELYSWSERNSEIEIIYESDGKIFPIEVKSGLRTKTKSLTQFIKKYNPSTAIVLSEKKISYINDEKKLIPLYYASHIKSFC